MKKIFKLPKGITGFTSIDDYFEVPEISEDTIVNSITNLAEKYNNYIFLSLENPNQSTNYYSINLLDKLGGKKYMILFNMHYNYFCCLYEKKSWCENIFGNLPSKIAEYIEEHNFQYLSKSILDKEATIYDLSKLTSSEKEQIEYWESKTLGEIIFNHYD